jgi:hypothetical protein
MRDFLKMTRKIDDRTYLKYLLQYINLEQLKQICRGYQIKGFSKFKKSELVEFILDSLSEEEYEELLAEKELEIISNGINTAIKKIRGEDRESISEINIVNPDSHEIEVSFSGWNWDSTSFLSITPKNIDDPERDCDCRIGLAMGFCSHFWVGFILSLKEGYFKLEDWTLTKLPGNFEELVESIKITTPSTEVESTDESGKISIIDESSDSSTLTKFLDTSITIHEGEITEITERESEFQGNVTKYYHVTLKNVRLGPRATKKSDATGEDVEEIKTLKIRISEKLNRESQLVIKDKIKLNGKLDKDNFWGILVKNIRKVEKL